MKKENKTIEMFESIPPFDTYSKYSHSLAKMFKYSSLQSLIYSLKHPRHFANKEYDQFTNHSPEKHHDKFDVIAFSKYLANSNSSPTPSHTHIPTTSSPTVRKKKLSPLNDIPDPCHYTPNYNAIYKKIPSVHIIPPSHNKSHKHSSSHTITHTNASTSRTISPIKRKVFETEISESSSNNDKCILPPIDYFGKNHALKFELYPDRKGMIINKGSDKVSYLEPIDYGRKENKAVDFGKMRERGQFGLVNVAHLYTPGLNYYKPKYDVIRREAPKVSFGKRGVVEKSRDFMVKQLWRSYDVLTEYQVVKECNEIKGEENENEKEKK